MDRFSISQLVDLMKIVEGTDPFPILNDLAHASGWDQYNLRGL